MDHIVPHAEGGGDEFSNLQLLCKFCHKLKSSAEGGRGSQRSYVEMRKRVMRPAEVHPGAVSKEDAVPRLRRGF